MIEKNCKWHFADQLGGQISGPNNSTKETFKSNHIGSLIREVIQNSLDARKSFDLPVTVKFSFRTLFISDYPELLNIETTLEACKNFYPDNVQAQEIYERMLDSLNKKKKKGSVDCLCIEDSGTKGMDYVPIAIDQLHNNKFLSFMRSLGVHTQQEHGTGGSFGFGKAAYFGLSPFSTVLTTTRSINENSGEIENYFEGTAWLSTHAYKINGNKILKSHVGYYDNNNGEPTNNEDDIPDFFKRRKEGTGTTFHILGAESDDRQQVYADMKSAVLENFWLAILKGELIVEIGDPNNLININKDNIKEEISKWENLEENFKKRSPKNYIETYTSNDDKNSLHKTYDLDKILLGKIETENKKPWGKIHISIMKDPDGNNKFQHLRRLLMKVENKGGFNKEGFHGVTIIEEGEADKLLQKTEPPQHNKWDESSLEARTMDRHRAKVLLDVITKLEMDAIAELFNYESRSRRQVKDIHQYCAIRTERQKIDNNSIDEGRSGKNLTTDISNSKIQSGDSGTSGTVLFTITSNSKPKKGGGLRGGSSDNRKNKNNKTKTRKQPENTDKEFSSDPNGKERRLYDSKKMKMHCRAQKDASEEYVHTLLITSTIEPLDNASLEISVEGASNTELIRIRKDSLEMGTVYDSAPNIITGVNLRKGLNEIPLKFEDASQKFAIKIAIKTLAKENGKS